MIKMNITHEIVNQSQFSRLKIRTFRHENLCVLSTLQSHFPALKTIISSRLPSNKINNYVKYVPYTRTVFGKRSDNSGSNSILSSNPPPKLIPTAIVLL